MPAPHRPSNVPTAETKGPMEALFDSMSAFGGVSPFGLAVICALVFLAGYIDAIAGGGGLISLPAYMIAGLPTHAALATNKLGSTMGTTVATIQYARQGFIRPLFALPCIACAIAGSTFGSNLVLLMDDSFLRFFMLLILPTTAFYVFRLKGFGAEQRQPLSPRRTVLISCLISLCIGIYDGFYGPGTGTFLLLLLTGAAHLGLGSAAGITKAVNLTTNATALAVFLVNGQVWVGLGLLAGCFSIAGNYLGARTFTKNGGAIARPLIIVVLCVFFAKVVYDLVTGA